MRQSRISNVELDCFASLVGDEVGQINGAMLYHALANIFF